MKKLIAAIFISIAPLTMLYAQDKVDTVAFNILDKALGKWFEKQSAAFYFEGIAYGVDKPSEIFSLPVYEVMRGGFWIFDGDKFEMQLGQVKGLSDGKLMVMIDEMGGTMYVDSVRHNTPVAKANSKDIEKLLDETFGDGVMTYEGKEPVNGKLCHKIKTVIKDEQNTHVIYWVNAQTMQILLMAEWQNGAYDVYWFKEITSVPANYNFSVHLPANEIKDFHGYQVFDMRFISNELNEKTN
jgi:hypothetical protein